MIVLPPYCPECRRFKGHSWDCPENQEPERLCPVCETPMGPEDLYLCSDCYREHPGE